MPDQRAIVLHRTRGSLTLERRVLRTIVTREVLDTPGVVRIGGRRSGSRLGRLVTLLFGSVADWVGLGDSRRGLRLELGDGEIAVGLTLVARYGVDLPELADAVRDRVTLAVGTLAGLEVRGVDVAVAALAPDPGLDGRARRASLEAAPGPFTFHEPSPH